MNKFKEIMTSIFDLIEVHLPMLAFIVLFVSYIILIVFRYIFFISMGWLYEINTFAFLWCGVLAVSYGSRSGTHVEFTILYDKLSEKAKLTFRLVGNFFVFILFLILLPNAYNAIAFLATRPSPILKMPYNILYFPFIILVGLTLIHYAGLIINDIKYCIDRLKGIDKL